MGGGSIKRLPSPNGASMKLVYKGRIGYPRALFPQFKIDCAVGETIDVKPERMEWLCSRGFEKVSVEAPKPVKKVSKKKSW